jgi:hypothetical protein
MSTTQSPIASLDQVTRRRGAGVLLEVLRSEGVEVAALVEGGRHAEQWSPD